MVPLTRLHLPSDDPAPLQDVSGNGSKAGIEKGDTIIYTSSFFGDELWPSDSINFTRTALAKAPSPVCIVFVSTHSVSGYQVWICEPLALSFASCWPSVACYSPPEMLWERMGGALLSSLRPTMHSVPAFAMPLGSGCSLRPSGW